MKACLILYGRETDMKELLRYLMEELCPHLWEYEVEWSDHDHFIWESAQWADARAEALGE